jgi:hypothetical protein
LPGDSILSPPTVTRTLLVCFFCVAGAGDGAAGETLALVAGIGVGGMMSVGGTVRIGGLVGMVCLG